MSTGLSLGFGALTGLDAYKKAKERGQSDAYAFKKGAAVGGGQAGGAILGAKVGRVLGSKFGKFGAGVGEIGGAYVGSMLGGDTGKAIMGASSSDKEWMKWANRSVQSGTPAQSATSRTGSRAVVRDSGGKERVGYLSYKDGKPVYKHGNDPSSLQYTSSNPLERIGRTIGSSDSLGPVSNWIKGYYSRKDESTRKRDVAAQRSRAGN